MSSSTIIGFAAFPAIAVLGGVLLPWLGMRMIVPSLEASGRIVRNYRGHEVCLGLGLVWVFWAAGSVLSVVFDAFIVERYANTGSGSWSHSVMGEHAFLAILVFGGFAFGLIDDALGGSEHRGFRGHLGELARGRLTTGALKLAGIGVLAVFAGMVTDAMGHDHIYPLGSRFLNVLPAALVIALSANTVNLLDVRPGRALKGYVALSLAGLGSMTWFALKGPGVSYGDDVALAVRGVLVLAVFAAGPVIAVWRYDLSERCMLGDAGANAAGMYAGSLIAIGMPTTGLVIVAAILLGLNLTSENVSFSAVIERTRLLAWLDSLGRLPEEEAEKRE